MKTNTMSYKCKQFLMFAGVTTAVFVAVVIVPFLYGIYLTLTSWDGCSGKRGSVYPGVPGDKRRQGAEFFPCGLLYAKLNRRHRAWLYLEICV